MKEKVCIINPAIISKRTLPLLVLSDEVRGPISFLIKVHSKGNYGHTMWLIEPNVLASQGGLYKRVPLKKYLTGRHRLKFWKPDLTGVEKTELIKTINKALNQPWWKRMYDYVGIFGQLFRLKSIQLPFQNYCSERDSAYIRKYIPKIPLRPSPPELNRACEKIERMHYYGHYFLD